MVMNMKEEFYFLKQDLEALDARIKELRDKLEETLKEGGESTRQSSETWHDNFPFEEAQRQFGLLARQLRDLVDLRKKAKEADFPLDKNIVGIGSIITIQNLDTGEIKSFKIGSFAVFAETGEKIISYDSPLARIIMGAKIGEVKSGMIGKNNVKFKITEISI
ncbi:hypothetical protein EPN15_00110 [Patescibacteria group bacterium]|nr:MAG: hypothetical protein EPN15_00110 [Patescibacteria group bacterium]